MHACIDTAVYIVCNIPLGSLTWYANPQRRVSDRPGVTQVKWSWLVLSLLLWLEPLWAGPPRKAQCEEKLAVFQLCLELVQTLALCIQLLVHIGVGVTLYLPCLLLWSRSSKGLQVAPMQAYSAEMLEHFIWHIYITQNSIIRYSKNIAQKAHVCMHAI